MLHGDIVTLTSDGILVHEKALQPLGIFDQSVCWAVWAANPHVEHDHYEYPNLIISPVHPRSWPFLIRLQLLIEDEKGALARACHWLERLNLSIRFAECSPTGFAHATWNVIAESTDKKVESLKAEKENFDKRHPHWRIPPNPAYGEAKDTANKIAAAMLTHVRRIENALEELENSQRKKKQNEDRDFKTKLKRESVDQESAYGLLRESQKGESSLLKYDDPPLLRIWDAQHFLYDGETVAKIMSESKYPVAERRHAEADANEYIRTHITKPYTVQYMQRLAYFSVYGGGPQVPFSLQYLAKAGLLKLNRPNAFSEGSVPLSPLPMHAIATFNSEDKYLRLTPVTSELVKKELTRIEIEYVVEGYGAPTEVKAKASQGFLARVCKELLEANVNLLHISNKWTRYEYAMEGGSIVFVADVSQRDYPRIDHRIRCMKLEPSDRSERSGEKDKEGATETEFNSSKSDETKVEGEKDQEAATETKVNSSESDEIKVEDEKGRKGATDTKEGVKIQDVRIYQYPHHRLFVSLHFGHPRDQAIRDMVDKVAQERGFELAIVETHIDPAPGKVLSNIRDCDAFLQMLSFRANEKPERTSFSWLDYEYGVASGRGIPTIRLVDVVRKPVDWWVSRVSINRDQQLKEFRSDVSDKELEQTIREAVGELANELLRRQEYRKEIRREA